MTLVLDEKMDGPATHALVIGVEPTASDPRPRYSAAASAEMIADLLLNLDIQDAPLASLDLLRSHPPVPGPDYVNPRDGARHETQRPTFENVRRAAIAWRERLDANPANIGILYHVGPTVTGGDGRLIALEGGAGWLPWVDLQQLWTAMAASRASRQLFFLDGAPAAISMGPDGPVILFAARGPRNEDATRAFYQGKVHHDLVPEGRQPSPMARALQGALQSGDSVGTRELSSRLNEYLRATAFEAQAPYVPSVDTIQTEFEGDFVFRYRAPQAREKAEGAGRGPPPAEPEPDRPLGEAEPAAADPAIDDQRQPFYARVRKLTETQRECLRLVQEGLTSRQIARRLALKPATVDHYVSGAMRTLGADNRREAARLFAQYRQAFPRPHPPPETTHPAPDDGAEGDPPLPDWARGLAGPNLGRRIARLTERQRLFLSLVGQGRSPREIASEIGRSPAAVNRELREATSILAVEDRGQAARLLAWHEGAIKDAVAPPAARLADAAPAETGPAEATRPPAPEPNTHFVSDDPEVERDELGRGPLAIALARRLHRIWCRSNGIKVPGGEEAEAGGEERAAFVLHLDAPWGGGKTSFANFLARTLNPFPAGARARAADGSGGPPKFLTERAGGSDAVGTIFIDDPPAAAAPAGAKSARAAGGAEAGPDVAAGWPEDARRPWIMVPFNAWQAEHCAPPWWVFYQAIRKGCFNSVWAEGRRASAPGQDGPPRSPSWAERLWASAGLWRRELWWRLRNPKILALLFTAAVAGALIVILSRTGVIFGGADGPAFDALGVLLAGVGGVTGLWGLSALLTESVAPGTDAVAERNSLGGGDPFDRFRRHFARTMAAVRRPVMVIVDDLDRCRPDFVVDLFRGIQTLLRSPRVVFVILGDRDWIERAFEAHHDAMKKVDVGAEQSFGARFVEKAIQMSFILPEMPDARQDDYVRRVLLGPGADRAAADAPAPPPAELSQQLRADYREQVASAETAEDRKQAEQVLRHKYQSIFQTIGDRLEEASDRLFEYGPGDYRAAPDAETAGAQADKLLGEERAMLAAVDERMGQALLHRLEPLARSFPPNPRQIKRIVNAITMYTCVAYLQMDMDETDGRGVELAIWVILMTEWPATWRLLAGCPDLVAAIAAAGPDEAASALAAIDPALLPGPAEAVLAEVMRVRADARLAALIRGGGPAGAPALSVESARAFRSFTPLYAGKRRLAAAGGRPAAGE